MKMSKIGLRNILAPSLHRFPVQQLSHSVPILSFPSLNMILFRSYYHGRMLLADWLNGTYMKIVTVNIFIVANIVAFARSSNFKNGFSSNSFLRIMLFAALGSFASA